MTLYIQLIPIFNVPCDPYGQYPMTAKLVARARRSCLVELDILLSLLNKTFCVQVPVCWKIPPILNVLDGTEQGWYFPHLMTIPWSVPRLLWYLFCPALKRMAGHCGYVLPYCGATVSLDISRHTSLTRISI